MERVRGMEGDEHTQQPNDYLQRVLLARFQEREGRIREEERVRAKQMGIREAIEGLPTLRG